MWYSEVTVVVLWWYCCVAVVVRPLWKYYVVQLAVTVVGAVDTGRGVTLVVSRWWAMWSLWCQ